MYALASLSLRFRWALVFAAFTIANTSKMAVAVLLAHVITRFQSHWTYLVSALAFFISAILIWLDESHEMGHAGEKRATRSKAAFVSFCSFFLTEWGDPGQRIRKQLWTALRAAFVSFCSFFLTEWGDPGQIAAAALVLRFHLTLAT